MMTDSSGPRRLRYCRQCGETLTIFHQCSKVALADQLEPLAQAVVETPSSEDEWAEIRQRFPLTANRIINAIEKEES